MRVGLFTAGYRRNALRDAFEDAARFGYDYIELLGERPHAYPPDMDAETLARITGSFPQLWHPRSLLYAGAQLVSV